MNFKILGSSSKGNCFLVNDDLLIDCGMPYSKIKDDVKNVKIVLLTHIHGDHFNSTTIRKLFVENEPIFICGEWLKEELENVIGKDNEVLTYNSAIEVLDYKVARVKAYHDVPNCGYRIQYGTHRHFHITDTNTLEGITAKNYDSASIECNHEIKKALELIEEAKENNEFSHLQGAINSHLSVDKTIKFCKENNIKKLYPVHIGSSTKDEVIKKLREW